MNKTDFSNEVARRCMVTSYVVDEIYNVSSGLVAEKMIAGEQVELPKFGKFTFKKRKGTIYKNLYGGKDKIVDETVHPTFTMSPALKNRIKNGYKYKKIT